MPSSMPPLGSRFVSQFKGHERRIRTLENRVSVVLPDNSIPGTPSFLTPLTSFYQSTSDGSTKAQITLTWSQPTNTDGSPVLDAAYYEIQYRPSTTFTAQPTHAQIAASAANTHALLNSGGYTHVSMPGATIPASSSDGDWHPITIPWNQNSLTIKELTPGVTYEIRIRFADTSTPTNLSAWSSSALVVAAADSLAPSQPAAPSVASSLIAIQVTHTLGKVGGGTYNLEGDLHHFEVHGSYEPTFPPTAATLLGKMIANAGMLTAQIPAIASFGVSSTVGVYVKVIAVDISGNKSLASAAASATATLIDDAHITDLSVSKLTAGTITAAILLAGSIKTADSGARVELDSMGVRLYDVTGANTVNFSAADGSAVLTGTVRTNWAPNTNAAIVIDPAFPVPGSANYPTEAFYDGYNVFGPARLNATGYGIAGAGGTQSGLNSGPAATGSLYNQSTALMRPDGWIVKFNDQAGNKKGGYVAGDSSGAHLSVTDSSGVQKSGLDLNSDGSWILNNNAANQGLQADASGNFFATSSSVNWSIGTNASLFNDTNDIWFFKGKWPNDVAADSHQALFPGQFAFNGQVVNVTYGATMASTMVAMLTMQNGSGGVFATVTAIASTSFTMTANVSANQNFNWWAFRV
jgi:hypothetical protein